MNTGTVETWAGEIADIGLIYPFGGSEALLCVVGLVLWLVWFVVQGRMENREYREEIEKYAKSAERSSDAPE